MKIKKKRRTAIRIDMTPMVDIAFLLLIFYMSTTQFKPPEKKSVNLPMSHSQISLPDKNVINVTVTAEDSIWVDYVINKPVNIDGRDVSMPIRVYNEATPSTVASVIIAARARNRQSREALLVVKADKETKYGTMEGIMETLQKENQSNFLIVTSLEQGM